MTVQRARSRAKRTLTVAMERAKDYPALAQHRRRMECWAMASLPLALVLAAAVAIVAAICGGPWWIAGAIGAPAAICSAPVLMFRYARFGAKSAKSPP